jgi:hypothetical protein
LFEQPITGAIYVAEPDDPATVRTGAENPFDSRFAVYLILRDPQRGILLSLPVRIQTDPIDGRLTAAVSEIPELPLSRLSLNFNSGPRAPLTTPSSCSTHPISYSLTPSSGNAPAEGVDSFSIGPKCDQDFAPALRAGTAFNAAGSEVPFVFELTNTADGPNLSSAQLTFPPGLTANLGDATICPAADIATAHCPPASRLGYARIAVGSGPNPLWVPSSDSPGSSVYLAGPYEGAPYSLLMAIPASAGPYDLGTVVTRAALRVDPASAQVSVELDSLPQIIAGVPLHYRALRIVLDRPGFIRNPTSCEPAQIIGTAQAQGGASASLATRFQAADCAALPFSPRLDFSLLGAPARNGRPALKAVISAGHGQAGIARAALTLPATELLEYAQLRSVCTGSRYTAGGGGGEHCPRGSRYGRARIFTPMFDRPLEGPLYLRSSSTPRQLPDLVASLDSGGTHLNFVAHTTSAKGLLRLVFGNLPDVPVQRVVIRLQGGRAGLLVNTVDLCRAGPHVRAGFFGHNRKRHSVRHRVKLNCADVQRSRR